jgi:hypothetical protein
MPVTNMVILALETGDTLQIHWNGTAAIPASSLPIL